MQPIFKSPRRRLLGRTTVIALLSAGGVAAFAPASALAVTTTLYVTASPNPNPTCAAASQTHPFHTIAAALACSEPGDTVLVRAGTFGGGFTVPNGILLEGAGANRTTISDATQLSVPEVTIAPGAVVKIEGITVAGGAGDNGGIVAGSGSLTLANVAVNATYDRGASDPAAVADIPTTGPSVLTISDSTISNNDLGLFAGGISAGAMSGPTVSVFVTDSTISGNSGGNEAGGLFVVNGALDAEDDTISGNSGGNAGGLWVGPETSATLADDLIAANLPEAASAVDCGLSNAGAKIVDDGHNLIGVANPGASGDCGFVNGTDGDLTGTPSTPLNPELGTLAANGGPTETQALLPGSPAIDAGNPANCNGSWISDLDQRGHSRAAAARLACDIGAYDTAGDGGQVWYVSDKATSSPTCASASSTEPFPTIAAALACVQNGDTVKLAAGKLSGGFTIPANIILEGAGARSTTIGDATGLKAAEIEVAPTVSAKIEGLAVDGHYYNPGILAASGNLVVERTLVTEAGLYAQDPAPVALDPSSGNGTLTILDSTVSNSYGNLAGGVYVSTGAPTAPATTEPPSTATILNSTIAGNIGEAQGGGVTVPSDASATLRDDTIAGNSGNFAGGLLLGTSGTASITDTVLSGNTSSGPAASQDCTAENTTGLTDGGHNLIGVADPGANEDCGFVNGTNGDLTGSPSTPLSADLGPLGLNGGTTPTEALQSGSPAIGAGNPADCVAAPVSDLDQRGESRNAASRDACDIGAYDTGGA